MLSKIAYACAAAALMVFCAGCGSPERQDVELTTYTGPTVERAQSNLQAGDLAEAERQARQLLRDEQNGFEAILILGESLIRQRKFEEFDRELSPPGKAYLFVESPRVRQEAKGVLLSDYPVGKLVMLEAISYTAAMLYEMPAGASERERKRVLEPFVEHLEIMINEDDRALGVLALDVMGGIGLDSSIEVIRKIAEGDDPLFSYLARGFLPVGRVER